MSADKRADHAAYMRRYWAENPEKRQQKIDRVKAKMRDPEQWAGVRLSSLKCRAKKRGMEFNLDSSDLQLPERCPILDIPLVLGALAHEPNSVHIDRIDSSRGYVKGNVRTISGRANYLKKDATLSEIAALHHYMKAHQEL